MDLKGSKTEKNLWEAFAGESQARNKYTYYASKAKKDGYEQIAAIFEETAQNEKEHANMVQTTKWRRSTTNRKEPKRRSRRRKLRMDRHVCKNGKRS